MAVSKKTVPKSTDIIVRGLREDFAKFFDDPSRDGFREMIRNHGGELRELDFKRPGPIRPRSLSTSSPSPTRAGAAS